MNSVATILKMVGRFALVTSTLVIVGLVTWERPNVMEPSLMVPMR